MTASIGTRGGRRAAAVVFFLFAAALVTMLVGVVAGGLDGERSEQPWAATATAGDFVLHLESARATYTSGEPLDVVATLTYRGPDNTVSVAYVAADLITFEMAAHRTSVGHGRPLCEQLVLDRDVPVKRRLVDVGAGGTPFGVRHGIHTIAATAAFGTAGCGTGGSLEASIVIAVADDADDVPIRTYEDTPFRACLLLINGGELASSDSGLGVVRGSELREVVWPAGYSARRSDDGIVLLGRDGKVIAHEGERVVFDATTPKDGPLVPCGGVTKDVPRPTPQAVGIATADVPTIDGGVRACTLALFTGWLERDERTGLGISAGDGDHLVGIVWPRGYTGWIEDGVVVIRSPTTEEVAREGDYVTLTGGQTGNGTFFTCGGIQHPTAPSPG